MKFRKMFDDFCKEHNYIGDIGYNKETEEYHIITSRGDDNAGAFMTKTELSAMGNAEIENLLNLLHEGFVLKFVKQK